MPISGHWKNPAMLILNAFVGILCVSVQFWAISTQLKSRNVIPCIHEKRWSNKMQVGWFDLNTKQGLRVDF